MLVLLASLGAAVCGMSQAEQRGDRTVERHRMVAEQLRARDIRDERVLRAIERVPRHLFVPDSVREEAYADHPLAIGFSAPWRNTVCVSTAGLRVACAS